MTAENELACIYDLESQNVLEEPVIAQVKFFLYLIVECDIKDCGGWRIW